MKYRKPIFSEDPNTPYSYKPTITRYLVIP